MTCRNHCAQSAGFMGILKRKYQVTLDADAREYIDHAVEGVERMKALINDLLTYSQVGTRVRP